MPHGGSSGAGAVLVAGSGGTNNKHTGYDLVALHISNQLTH